jgi:hypothetical protein
MNEKQNNEQLRQQQIEDLVRSATEASIGTTMEDLKAGSIFELESPSGAKKIKYFGTHHVKDPEDSILKQIGQELTGFFVAKDTTNCRLIIESARHFGLDPTRELMKSWIAAEGEAEYAFLKTQALNIEASCFEPVLSTQIDHVDKMFERDPIFLMFVGRAIVNYSPQRHGSLSFEDYLKPQLERFAREASWEDYDISATNLDRIYQEITGRPFTPDEKQRFRQLYDPKKETNPVNHVGREVHIFRDTEVVKATDSLLQEGKTDLFFVYGNGHALTQRAAIKFILEN